MTRIFVAGATGKQGGAIVRAIAEHNANSATANPVQIVGLTRDPTSAKAQAVVAKNPNVTLVKGNLSNPTEVEEIFQEDGPFHGVFSIQETFIPDEVEQGKLLGDLAVKYGVNRFVFTSGDMSGLAHSGLPFFETKRQIELHLATLPTTLGWTVIRPPAFYENLFISMMDYPWAKGVYSILDNETKLKMISSSDIGRIAATVLLEPTDKYVKKVFSIAGSSLSKGETFDVLKKNGIKFEKDNEENIPAPLLGVFQFMNAFPWEADAEETKKEFPFVKSLSEWLKTEYAPSA
ncbi:hypothetical protein IAR55_002585 [Kwoniella newhampshirensis]|uniref:NmrA-like domain-containing protein n=1 Tax=Kwoniella newhampshirensis TaxID=1651941 RepID=A0AAW0Z1V3_9TREE